ncbi:MAG: hypothetical protein AAGC68_02410 [Verrucomicrobiota bacterium]
MVDSNPHQSGLLLFLVATLVAAAGSRGLSNDAPAAPEQIDLSNFPGEIVDQVVVPIPAEIFAVLDKLDEPDWSSGIIVPEGTGKSAEVAILALTFGSLVGEGFIAVQAEQSNQIQEIGRKVLKLSESLGLKSAVQPHSLSIIEAADSRDWEAVREELDSTQQTVRATMEKLRDEELADLVSLGGWLRGTNVVTYFISESFREDKAELLNQPGLISHFREMLNAMEGPSSSSPEIRSISTGLARMEAIIAAENEISEEEINELYSISQEMLEQYYFDLESEKGG